MLQRTLFLIPILALAGCSNSPAPEPFVAPRVPEIVVVPTPTPLPSVALDTDKFIAGGEQLNALERRAFVKPTTAMDKYIYQKTGQRSLSNVVASLLNEIDASNTSLADDFLVLKAKVIKTLTEVISGVLDRLIANDTRFAALKSLRTDDRQQLAKQTQQAIIDYAVTKYQMTTRTLPVATARNNMAVYRSRALRGALALDRLSYNQMIGLERANADQ